MGEKKSSCEHFFSHSPSCLLKLWSGRAMLVRNPSLIFKCGNRNLKKFSSSVDNPGTHKYSSLGIDANSITLFTSNSSRNRNLTRVSDKFSIMAVTAFLIQGDWYYLLDLIWSRQGVNSIDYSNLNFCFSLYLFVLLCHRKEVAD
mgnify:CR=1 FL=1